MPLGENVCAFRNAVSFNIFYFYIVKVSAQSFKVGIDIFFKVTDITPVARAFKSVKRNIIL